VTGGRTMSIHSKPDYWKLDSQYKRTIITKDGATNLDTSLSGEVEALIGQTKYGYKVKEYTNTKRGLSGVVIVTSKKAWHTVGGFDSGFLRVDWNYTKKCLKAGLKTYIMEGVYVYHWYRGNSTWTERLKK
jgi:hypothetical protein